MSNFSGEAFHPRTGKPVLATWYDRYFANGDYGVLIEGEIYRGEDVLVAARCEKCLIKACATVRDRFCEGCGGGKPTELTIKLRDTVCQ